MIQGEVENLRRQFQMDSSSRCSEMEVSELVLCLFWCAFHVCVHPHLLDTFLLEKRDYSFFNGRVVTTVPILSLLADVVAAVVIIYPQLHVFFVLSGSFGAAHF